MAIYVDDKQLVAAHQAGDTEAFDELVNEHRQLLLAHARKKLWSSEAAEDALQETLIRAYRALPRFNGEYKLAPWLHRIMANVCVDEITRRQRDGERIEKIVAEPSGRLESPGVEEELGLEFDDTALTAALEDLPPTHREALTLRFVDDLEYKEVASVVGASEQNVRARVSRARASVRSALKGVAAVPVFLLGVLRRGEKAAAAATSTTGAVVTSSGITKAGLVAQVAPSTTAAIPTISEAAVTVAHTAPTAVPVIAKAAVGIGLAAAVLTPNADGALHHVIQSVATDQGNELLLTTDSEKQSQGALGELATGGTPGGARVASDSERIESQVVSASTQLDGDTSPTVFASSQLLVEEAGAGRMRLQGSAIIQLASGKAEGILGAASQLRMSSEFVDADGRQRLDGLLVLEIPDTAQPIEIRIAGFVSPNGETMEFTGVYRLSSPDEPALPAEGQVEGQMWLPRQQTLGSMELILQQ